MSTLTPWEHAYYGGSAGGGGNAGTVLGTSFGLNVGSETLRVQLGITGLFLGAVAVLFLLHRAGNRFSVHT